MPADTIPVLRLDHARRPDGRFAPAFLDRLRTALHEVGFLQLTHFGAAPGQVEELAAAADRCFALPLADRLALDNRRSPTSAAAPGSVTRSPPADRTPASSWTFAPERPAVPRAAWDAPFRLLEGPNQWPDRQLPELRTVVLAWPRCSAGSGPS